MSTSYPQYDRAITYDEIINKVFDMTEGEGVHTRLMWSTQSCTTNLLDHMNRINGSKSDMRYFQCEVAENKWMTHVYDLLGTLN